MARQLLQDGSVFEITDHTTASDWERFIANLEDVLTDWGLHKQSDQGLPYRELPEGYISNGLWCEKHDLLRFGNVVFDLRYQYLIDSDLHRKDEEQKDKLRGGHWNRQKTSPSSSPCIENEDEAFGDIPTKEEKEHSEHELPDNAPQCLFDLIATTNDFASKAHCLVRWYNLRRFIILVPRGDTIVTEDRIKLILSSASIALANIDCHVPIFVQTHNPKSNFYQGISEHLNIRTMYEMILYKQCLRQYEYLSELIGVFREKTGCNLNDPISATIRLNYCLDFFDLFVHPTDEFAGNEHLDDDQEEMIPNRKKNQKLLTQDMRTSATFDQVKEALDDCLPHPYKILRFLHVAALWPPVSDKVMTDSRVHSDLDPAEAPIWTIRSVISDNCNMKIVHETQVVYKLLYAAINFAYDKLDAHQIFTDCDKESLKADCLKLSYELAIKPEVILSRSPSDNIRKLVALLFYRASELRADLDALDQIAGQFKKSPSLSEIYRDFKKHKPTIKEFIIRAQISRPFNPKSTPVLPQRMFCTICDEEFRLCGAFSELCN